MDVDVVLHGLRSKCHCVTVGARTRGRPAHPTLAAQLARRRVRVIVCVVGEGALHVPFARKAWVLSHSACVRKETSVFVVIALLLLTLSCGVLVSTLSAADTDPREAVW